MSSQFAPSQTDCVGFLHDFFLVLSLHARLEDVPCCPLGSRWRLLRRTFAFAGCCFGECTCHRCCRHCCCSLPQSLRSCQHCRRCRLVGSSSLGTNIGVAALLCLWHELSLLLLCRWHEPWGFSPFCTLCMCAHSFAPLPLARAFRSLLLVRDGEPFGLADLRLLAYVAPLPLA